jgi:hypothetical protein
VLGHEMATEAQRMQLLAQMLDPGTIQVLGSTMW